MKSNTGAAEKPVLFGADLKLDFSFLCCFPGSAPRGMRRISEQEYLTGHQCPLFYIDKQGYDATGMAEAALEGTLNMASTLADAFSPGNAFIREMQAKASGEIPSEGGYDDRIKVDLRSWSVKREFVPAASPAEKLKTIVTLGIPETGKAIGDLAGALDVRFTEGSSQAMIDAADRTIGGAIPAVAAAFALKGRAPKTDPAIAQTARELAIGRDDALFELKSEPAGTGARQTSIPNEGILSAEGKLGTTPKSSGATGTVVAESGGTQEVKQRLGTDATAGTAPDTNPGFPAAGRIDNCVNCAIATDATFAGRPASALPYFDKRGLPISEIPKGLGVENSFTGARSLGDVTTAFGEFGAGARGVVFGDRGPGRAGHVFNVVVDQRGVVKFWDGQSKTRPVVEGQGYKSFQWIRTDN